MSDKSWEPRMFCHTLTLSHSITLHMLNNFCFHVYGPAMVESPISPIQEKKSPIILYRRPKSLKTSYILTSHLIIFLKKFRNGVKRAKSNKNIYFVKLYFWFGFLLNVFCRSLQNYPIQNCFKCCYVKFSGSEKILYFEDENYPIFSSEIEHFSYIE